MSDFVNIADDYRRMCRTNGVNACSECPLKELVARGNELGGDAEECAAYVLENSRFCELLIKKWAKEHPGPRYPTFREWYREYLPEVDLEEVCVRSFGIHSHETCCTDCASCLNMQMPKALCNVLHVEPRMEW